MDTPYPTNTMPCPVYACPHCSGVLDLTPLVPLASTTTDPTATSTAPAGRVPAALDRWSCIVRGLHQLSTPRRALPGLPHWLRWGLSALILLFLLGVLIWQQWAAPATPVLAPSATATNAAAASNHSTTASVNSDQAAVLAVVAAYNAAEAQVAQTLVLSPTLPLLEPQGLLAQRRAREIAWRQQTHAAHATRLLRWAIGAIEIDPIGTNATITTQESWQDQVGSNLPRTATVRVLYTLRRADAQSTWRIVDAESTPL